MIRWWAAGCTWAERIDERLMAVPRPWQYLAVGLTLALLVVQSLPNIPRQYVDLSSTIVGDVQRYETYGPDSLSDMYGSRVVWNHPLDMYTRALTEQTPLEARTWSKEAAAPYPPAVLLAETGLYAIGEATGVGFYGMILGCATLFVGLSALYFLRTRWYLFPLLYLNVDFISYRFVYVQDNTYLVMLVVIMAALWLARIRHPWCDAMMAVATTMKLSPLYYVKNVFAMPPARATVFLAILAAGLVLPYFIWDNYLYIYRYGNALKGDWLSTLGALLFAVPFALVVWYVEVRRGFDAEDRVGWGLVPFALFLAFKMNVARHLLLVLLVPDKRGVRNVAAAVGLAVPALAPTLVAFNSALAIATVVLVAGLVYQLEQIGWPLVARDLRHPRQTARLLLGRTRAAGAPAPHPHV
jgi:hypothetical protein